MEDMIYIEVNQRTKERRLIKASELRLDKNTKVGDIIDCKAKIEALEKDNKNLKETIIALTKVMKQIGLKTSFNEADIAVYIKEEK